MPAFLVIVSFSVAFYLFCLVALYHEGKRYPSDHLTMENGVHSSSPVLRSTRRLEPLLVTWDPNARPGAGLARFKSPSGQTKKAAPPPGSDPEVVRLVTDIRLRRAKRPVGSQQ